MGWYDDVSCHSVKCPRKSVHQDVSRGASLDPAIATAHRSAGRWSGVITLALAETAKSACTEPNASPRIKGTSLFMAPPNGSRLSCGALKKDSFYNLRAPPASSAC